MSENAAVVHLQYDSTISVFREFAKNPWSVDAFAISGYQYFYEFISFYNFFTVILMGFWR